MIAGTVVNAVVNDPGTTAQIGQVANFLLPPELSPAYMGFMFLRDREAKREAGEV